MRIKVFTLFPDMLRPMLAESILGRAIRAGLLDVELINIRDYTQDKHNSTDDYPFGGGAGMVMSAQPIVDAITQNTPEDFRGRRIYLSPRGRTFNQRIVEELAAGDDLMLLCGHYEGVDQRALDMVIDEELSIGDYVLTGGELGALVVIDAVSRLVPGVLGSEESDKDESFTTGLLEYPQYTRPAEFRGHNVPEVLLGGNHADITAWRREQSLELTLARRPEMLESAPLSDDDRAMLRRIEIARAFDERLHDAGIGFERYEMRLADLWPKQWFASFVPEAQRKAAKKQCFSGRRHVGYLWQAFSMGYAPCTEGEAAHDAWHRETSDECMLYLPGDRLLYRTGNASKLCDMLADVKGGAILADVSLTRTFVIPNRPGVPDFYAEKA